MPVIVVGADTKPGRAIVSRLADPRREIRVFITDPSWAEGYRELGTKVATGDVSDRSHVEAAAMRCHTAVLVAEAASDERERSFAEGPAQVMEGWAEAVADAAVKRVIWVGISDPPRCATEEAAVVPDTVPGMAEIVAELDEAQRVS